LAREDGDEPAHASGGGEQRRAGEGVGSAEGVRGRAGIGGAQRLEWRGLGAHRARREGVKGAEGANGVDIEQGDVGVAGVPAHPEGCREVPFLGVYDQLAGRRDGVDGVQRSENDAGTHPDPLGGGDPVLAYLHGDAHEVVGGTIGRPVTAGGGKSATHEEEQCGPAKKMA
jgi:hypothetical protein